VKYKDVIGFPILKAAGADIWSMALEFFLGDRLRKIHCHDPCFSFVVEQCAHITLTLTCRAHILHSDARLYLSSSFRTISAAITFVAPRRLH